MHNNQVDHLFLQFFVYKVELFAGFWACKCCVQLLTFCFAQLHQIGIDLTILQMALFADKGE